MRRPGRSSSISRWRPCPTKAESTKPARYRATSPTVDGPPYGGAEGADGSEADRRRRRSLSVVKRRGQEGTGATFVPRPGESSSSDRQSATQRAGLIPGSVSYTHLTLPTKRKE